MKKFRICLEIQDLGQDEHGDPCPGGLCLSIGPDDAEEVTAEEYQNIMKAVSLEGVLKAAFLDGLYAPEQCRLIMPAEYDAKYGEAVSQ